MGYLNRKSNYDKYPTTRIVGFDDCATEGWEAVCARLRASGARVVTVDCYPGVYDEELLPALVDGLKPSLVVESKDMFYDGDELTRRMEWHLTDDRVRGVMYYGEMDYFIDENKRQQLQEKVEQTQGSVLVYGFGASRIARGSILVYADMARWEIQQRQRKGMPNFKQQNYDEDPLRKYKRSFFIEWRIADRHKRKLYQDMDFYLDTNCAGKPKMVTGEALLAGLKELTRRPFRLVPYFDPGVWGGEWMREVCGLDAEAPNYAWSFDGVPEENSLYLQYGNVRIETPAMNLVQYLPRELLGEKNFARFGAEYPIRFDFLDTMGGQNLSLQVHPLTEYIKSKFGMPYTQDESYYILDCEPGGGVYLGLKEGIDPQRMLDDLRAAQAGTKPFPADQYVNRFPASKHDHFLIPAGTVHCSSAGCMVLEVSATPYIFTFKLWDWDRVGLDGKPRPIHIEDGAQVIQFNRTTEWVKNNLVNRFEVLSDTEAYTRVKTGLHELEFVETYVDTICTQSLHQSHGEFSMLNLVDGEAAIVESADGRFAPYEVHYAETFILPAGAGDFIIRPVEEGQKIKVLRAFVRNI